MRPLNAIALGFLIIGIEYPKGGDYDLLPDPLGWLLVLVGLKVLVDRVSLPRRAALWTLGLIALAVSGALWAPEVREWFEDAESAVQWAIDVPPLAFCALLCHTLAARARAVAAAVATAWLQWTAIGFVLSVIGPVVVIGGGVEDLRAPFEFVAGLAQLSLFVLCLTYASREWAGAPPQAGTDGQPSLPTTT